jgi:hypothetical protein
MKIKLQTLAFIAALSTAGCFTVNETPYPSVSPSAAPADKAVNVQLSGFEAAVTTYVPVYGYETVLSSAHGHGPRRHRLYATTIATETYVPQVNNSTAFIDRATDTLEKCGYVLQTTNPKYRIEVKFSGPFVTDGEVAKSAAWSLLTVFTADYGTQTWTARLKIHELATGKVVLFRDYTQKYESLVWGPLPIFSPAGSDKSDYNMMQSWCLTALTDRAMADATAFLSKN